MTDSISPAGAGAGAGAGLVPDGGHRGHCRHPGSVHGAAARTLEGQANLITWSGCQASTQDV